VGDSAGDQQLTFGGGPSTVGRDAPAAARWPPVAGGVADPGLWCSLALLYFAPVKSLKRETGRGKRMGSTKGYQHFPGRQKVNAWALYSQRVAWRRNREAATSVQGQKSQKSTAALH